MYSRQAVTLNLVSTRQQTLPAIGNLVQKQQMA